MTDRPPRKLYLGTVVPVVAVLATMTILVSYSPTLYRLFCGATGLAGTTQRSLAAPAADAADANPMEVTVNFDANVDKALDWDFRPGQTSVKVKLGVPTEAFFVAHNRSDKTIVGRAVYNVAPFQVGPYFYKIQCFCFTNEKLGPGETAKMPLVFYVDRAFGKDPEMRLFNDITLSYTFFREKDLTPDAVRQARDLAVGSQSEATAISQNTPQSFANDAPRR
jgi:cytochrome c oxidase assembly protein subunit 11